MNDLPTRTSPGGLAARDDDVDTVYAVLQSRTWGGPWEPPGTMHVVSVLGNVVLDYRDAFLPPGETHVVCSAFLGNVEVLVPADVDVELTGSILLGSVETRQHLEPIEGLLRIPESRSDREGDPGEDDERPLLTVACSGVMGSIEVKLA